MADKNHPQNRYATPLRTKTRWDGNKVYRTARPKGPRLDPLRDIRTPGTDVLRMDKIAHRHFGNANEWWRIASANRRVDGSMYFRPGSDVIIPNER